MFAAAVAKCPEIMACYAVAANFDFLLDVICPDLVAFQRFRTETLERISGVRSVTAYPVLSAQGP